MGNWKDTLPNNIPIVRKQNGFVIFVVSEMVNSFFIGYSVSYSVN